MTEYRRGDVVLLLAYRGENLRRRVWQDMGRGVAICSEERYQAAILTGAEPPCVGWPREDVLEILEPVDAVQADGGEEAGAGYNDGGEQLTVRGSAEAPDG